MTMGTLEGTRVPVSRVVIALLVLGAIVPATVGLLLAWLGAVAPPAYWDTLDRVLIVAMAIAMSVFFVIVGLGIVRYNVMGIPPVRLAAAGVKIGDARVGWEQVGTVGAMLLYGVPYLTVEVDPALLGGVSWVDRKAMRFAAPPGYRTGALWITEQQLGTRVDIALDLAPRDHTGR